MSDLKGTVGFPLRFSCMWLLLLGSLSFGSDNFCGSKMRELPQVSFCAMSENQIEDGP